MHSCHSNITVEGIHVEFYVYQLSWKLSTIENRHHNYISKNNYRICTNQTFIPISMQEHIGSLRYCSDILDVPTIRGLEG